MPAVLGIMESLVVLVAQAILALLRRPLPMQTLTASATPIGQYIPYITQTTARGSMSTLGHISTMSTKPQKATIMGFITLPQITPLQRPITIRVIVITRTMTARTATTTTSHRVVQRTTARITTTITITPRSGRTPLSTLKFLSQTQTMVHTGCQQVSTIMPPPYTIMPTLRPLIRVAMGALVVQREIVVMPPKATRATLERRATLAQRATLAAPEE